MVPNSLREISRAADTRLSTLIDKARFSRDTDSYLKEHDRARADRVFAEISSAVERGLKTVDPRSPDVEVLERLRSELKSR